MSIKTNNSVWKSHKFINYNFTLPQEEDIPSLVSNTKQICHIIYSLDFSEIISARFVVLSHRWFEARTFNLTSQFCENFRSYLTIMMFVYLIKTFLYKIRIFNTQKEFKLVSFYWSFIIFSPNKLNIFLLFLLFISFTIRRYAYCCVVIHFLKTKKICFKIFFRIWRH